MDAFSRREFIFLSAASCLLFPLHAHAMNEDKLISAAGYPNTVLVLEKAFTAEMMAHKHYVKFVEKALEEKFHNIAYMFQAFSISEKIHADNYQRISNTFGGKIADVFIPVTVNDTKSNLTTAAERELEKIEKTYPGFIEKVEPEGCEEAIVNFMYSWKSHRQHEKKVQEILRYSGMFFGAVADKIEGMNLDFHVCRICGSTIDVKPSSPCEICNRSMAQYSAVKRPA